MKQNEIGTNLKLLREEMKLTQRQLGVKLGVCNQTVSFWENGSREPDLDMLVKIAGYFGVSTDYLLGIEE